MGLFDQILGGVLGQLQGAGGGQSGIVGALLQLIQNQPGGLQGLLARFSEAGLGQQAQSWVSTGQNLPVSPDQLTQVFGGGQLQQLAQQFGLSQEHVATGLSHVLPDVVDKLTPSGQVQDNDIAAGLEMLRGKFLG
ncbi:MAG TPA: YidB family protein [Burkholderiales bacterium]|nr:YidB family protein [Burkholderiales bacterium]